MDKYDYLIVGSGAGGATLARELTRRGRRPLVVEIGKLEEKFGSFSDARRFFDKHKLTKMPRKSREGVFLYRTLMADGSTFLSFACGVRLPNFFHWRVDGDFLCEKDVAILRCFYCRFNSLVVRFSSLVVILGMQLD